MTAQNPYPLANPFNRRRFSNFQNGSRKYVGAINRKNLTVPNQDIPPYGSDEWYEKYGVGGNDALTVPNQDIPPGDRLGSGFIQNGDDIFRLSDGTIVDFKRRKIISAPEKSNEYWGDPNKTMTMPYAETYSTHPTDQTMADLIRNVDKYTNTPRLENALQLDPESAAYWLKAEEEAERLRSSMTQAQKDVLADFERHFPKSRLIEESKKR